MPNCELGAPTSSAVVICIVGLWAGVALGEDKPLFGGIDEAWLHTIVSVEQPSPDGLGAVGTAFLASTRQNHMVLISAAHVVFEANLTQRPSLNYRVASISGTSVISDESLEKSGAGKWFRHKAKDVAIRFFGISPGMTPRGFPLTSFVRRDQIRAGNPCMVLGFPLGLRSVAYAHPIVRRCSVARSDPDELLLDASVFPGNSGGPAVYIPPFQIGPQRQGSPLQITADYSQDGGLLGVISEALSYTEVAISAQTRRPRVTFEDNMGLARVVPSDAILELLERDDIVRFEAGLARP